FTMLSTIKLIIFSSPNISLSLIDFLVFFSFIYISNLSIFLKESITLSIQFICFKVFIARENFNFPLSFFFFLILLRSSLLSMTLPSKLRINLPLIYSSSLLSKQLASQTQGDKTPWVFQKRLEWYIKLVYYKIIKHTKVIFLYIVAPVCIAIFGVQEPDRVCIYNRCFIPDTISLILINLQSSFYQNKPALGQIVF